MNQPAKLRVAHIITQLELGGAQRNTLYTVKHLDPAAYAPVLICGRGGILDEEAKAGSWPTHFLRSLVRPVNPVKDAIALVSLYKLLRRIKPHIVHTHSSKAGILGRIAAYVAGVPVIIHTFHGFGFTPGQRPAVRRFFTWVEKMCARLNTHLIFVSEENKLEAGSLKIGSTIPASLIRSGIFMGLERRGLDRKATYRKLAIPEDAWVVVSTGNFKPQKNPMDLVRVAAEVLKQKPSMHFVFLGDGDLRKKVEAWAKEQQIDAQLHFPGWCTRQSPCDVSEILAISKCFLLTSLWEGLPRALVEALAARLPAVAYGVDGVRDILHDGENGFLIPPGNVNLAAEKILWLADNPLKAFVMGQRGHDLVSKEFDIDFMVRKQENLYQTLYRAVPLKTYYEPLWDNPSQPQ
jgi:glycosyltransferase involved in cell wall biosynthesis